MLLLSFGQLIKVRFHTSGRKSERAFLMFPGQTRTRLALSVLHLRKQLLIQIGAPKQSYHFLCLFDKLWEEVMGNVFLVKCYKFRFTELCLQI